MAGICNFFKYKEIWADIITFPRLNSSVLCVGMDLCRSSIGARRKAAFSVLAWSRESLGADTVHTKTESQQLPLDSLLLWSLHLNKDFSVVTCCYNTYNGDKEIPSGKRDRYIFNGSILELREVKPLCSGIPLCAPEQPQELKQVMYAWSPILKELHSYLPFSASTSSDSIYSLDSLKMPRYWLAFFFLWGKGTCETMLSTGDYTELVHVGAW